MRAYLKCNKCGATGIAQGSEEHETNSFEITEDPDEWDGGDASCRHEDFEIYNTEYDSPLEGDHL